ncbi:hypothetical protein PA598K_05709 [Paenibacillus sp. 598K]|uniref:AMP-binding protein n=1 Tax=Paenibacillus sp. 598K TaxID=1117987 RepID=UPI000FF9A003|nr:AMP-binding protein [Paenibacillus sp. 598K]GBF77175.1 hypothetical protein PA598K_05709 [Paenibacillus sp. 598K]
MIPSPMLDALVRRLAELHPGYGQLLREHAATWPGLALSDLPLLTSERLEQCYYSQQPPAAHGRTVYRTSGTSTGVSRAIYYSPKDEMHYAAAKTDSYRRWLQTPPIPDPPLRKALADVGTGHAAATAPDIFRMLGMETETLAYSQPIEAHIALLETYRPELLYTMPSILEGICRAAARPASLGIRKVILVGEIASPAWQAAMTERLGIGATDMLDTYGSIEVGAIAAYDHRLRAYVLDEGLYAETVTSESLDSRYMPLEPGEAVLVLTSLHRSLFPVIRFVTYDVVRNLRTVETDEGPRQIFDCVAKRIGPELKHGEKISLYDIEEIVHRYALGAELRVSVRDNRLAVEIRSTQLAADQLPAIRSGIECKIPAIGKMIAGGMLEPIEVKLLGEREPWGLAEDGIKAKKLYR